MHVKIVNAVRACQLDVARTTFVASLKAAYLDSDGFDGDKGCIHLVFRGRPLEDLKQLKDYGIEHGSVLAHVAVRGDLSSPPLDYKSISAHLESAKDAILGGHADPEEYSQDAENATWRGEWTRGKDWEKMPPVLVGSTGLSRGDLWDEGDEGGETRVPSAKMLTDKWTPKATEAASASGSPFVTHTTFDGSNARAATIDEVAGSPYAAHNPFDGSAARGTPPKGVTPREQAAREREAQRSRHAIVPRQPEIIAPYSGDRGIAVPPPARFFRQLYVAQVGRFMFRVLHRLEGRWTGDAEVHLPGRSSPTPDARVCTVSLSFDDIAGVWRENQSLTTRDGLVSMQGSPEVRHRTARRSADSAFAHSHSGLGSTGGRGGGSTSGRSAPKEYDMTLSEQSDHLLVLTAYSRSTGLPILVETMTLISDMSRVRTVQRFDESGKFQCMYLIREERVIDAVTGAMVEPPRSRAGRATFSSAVRTGATGTHV